MIDDLSVECDGLGLVVPYFRMSLYLDLILDLEEVADFYEAAIELIGEQATFHRTANRPMMKIAPGTLAKKARELRSLRPGQSYLHELFSAKLGKGPAEAIFTVRHLGDEHPLDRFRSEWLEAAEEIERTGVPHLTPPGSSLQLCLPVDHPLT